MKKSIRAKILYTMIIITVALLAISSGVSMYLNYRTTFGVLEQSLVELADGSAKRVKFEIEAMRNVVTEMGCNPLFSSEDVSVEEKQSLIQLKADSYSYLTRGNLLDTSGTSIFDEKNYAEREYFQKAMIGETFISDPVVSKVTGKLSFIVAAPIWEGGIENSQIVGVIYMVPTEDFLNQIVMSIEISENAGSQLLNKDGTIIAHKDVAMIESGHNTIEIAKTDPNFAALAELEARQVKGESGFGRYMINGVNKVMAFAPIPDSNGWTMGVNAPVDDFMDYTYQSLIISGIILGVGIIITIIFASSLASGIGRPISEASKRLTLLAQGDLTSPVPAATTQDEGGQLLTDMAKCVENLDNIIADISLHLGEMSQSNLTGEFTMDYVGDFGGIKSSMIEISDSLNHVIGEIRSSTDSVSTAASEIAAVSQSLAQASTEQSAQIHDLEQTFVEISEQSVDTARQTNGVAEYGEQMQESAVKSEQQINGMMKAVQEIYDSSQAIGNVIKTIEDIAFQTNILALNAAVEAARAGEHGKGFAVVADEVRNLASKSAEASKDSSALIQNNVEKASEGYEISKEVSDSLKSIITAIADINTAIGVVRSNTEQESQSISNVKTLMDEQAKLVDMNSSTSEEAAATSEEMSGQAAMLQELVAGFKLKEVKPKENSIEL